MDNYAEHAINLRREIHMYPEIGYDLPHTLALVRRELTDCGIPFTEKFGQSSIVGTINEHINTFTIGIRADMDALPIQEETDVPFRSRNPGVMHACGHDIHTAILLGTARKLNDMKDKLNCRVKLLFQPAEEYTHPGAQKMADDGVMDDIDCIIALHVDGEFDVGTIGIPIGGQGGNSMGFTVEMSGESVHAANQEKGRDAILMCVEAYEALELMAAKEVAATDPCVLNIGSFHGGTTNNIVCNNCKMFGTIRTQSDSLSEYLRRRIIEISDSVAKMRGGRSKVEIVKFLPYVWNNPDVANQMYKSALKIVSKDQIREKKRNLGGEDFSFFCRKKPGMMLRLGIRNREQGCIYGVHHSLFKADENCMPLGINLFSQFVIDSMDGFPLPDKAVPV